MKTIGEYKREFVKLLLELEKEHEVNVKSVVIEQSGEIHINAPQIGYETSRISCKINIQ